MATYWEPMSNDFITLKNRMEAFAIDVGNAQLAQACSYSKNLNDLRSCVKQAYGVGSERFKEAFKAY